MVVLILEWVMTILLLENRHFRKLNGCKQNILGNRLLPRIFCLSIVLNNSKTRNLFDNYNIWIKKYINDY